MITNFYFFIRDPWKHPPMLLCVDLISTFSPRATRYAELGGAWKSEVNKGNHAGQGSSINHVLLAHLSRRLEGELIVYQSSCRLCVCL